MSAYGICPVFTSTGTVVTNPTRVFPALQHMEIPVNTIFFFDSGASLCIARQTTGTSTQGTGVLFKFYDTLSGTAYYIVGYPSYA